MTHIELTTQTGSKLLLPKAYMSVVEAYGGQGSYVSVVGRSDTYTVVDSYEGIKSRLNSPGARHASTGAVSGVFKAISDSLFPAR